MSKLNNVKINFFHKLGEYLHNASFKANTHARKLDAYSEQEFNAVAIPGLPAGASVEAYENFMQILPNLNTYITPQGKYPINNSGKSFYLKFNVTNIPLVIGNFAIPDKEPPLKENVFGHSKNITLKSSNHALQEMSSGMDGAYLDLVKEKSLFDLEEIVFEPLFGKPMKNPLVIFSKNKSVFLYKSINQIEKELEHPNLISSNHIPFYLHHFLNDVAKDMRENIFSYNTVKFLDLNTNILSSYKSKK
ncbi:hypothetical protein KO361_01635 [Candidatus Woesearchaeota archaeon]|nr:hypothetical protein [Candidatus Woesearchaeota archaeon]